MRNPNAKTGPTQRRIIDLDSATVTFRDAFDNCQPDTRPRTRRIELGEEFKDLRTWDEITSRFRE
jgi:hypothetical protein